jgi:AICAR transformylase/IMP cyclohydrolase PurH
LKNCLENEKLLIEFKNLKNNIFPKKFKNFNYIKNLKKEELMLKFENKIENIKLIGSYLLRSTSKSNLNVNLVISYPKDYINENDLLNLNLYLKKRNSFLISIFKKLKTIEMFSGYILIFFKKN